MHGRQIHELYRTSHRIYSLYRILLTVSSSELGPGTSSPSSCEVARFSSRFLEGETSSLHWVKSRFSVRFGISLMQMTRNSPCLDLVSMLPLASGRVKMRLFLTPYSQNSPWERTLKMTCFIAQNTGGNEPQGVIDRTNDRQNSSSSRGFFLSMILKPNVSV